MKRVRAEERVALREAATAKRARYTDAAGAEFDFGSVYGPPQIIFQLLLECDAEKTCRALACASQGWNAAWNHAWTQLIAIPLDKFYAKVEDAVRAFQLEISKHGSPFAPGIDFEWKLPDPTTMLPAYARRPTHSLCQWADRMWPPRPESVVLFDKDKYEAILNFWNMFDPGNTLDRRRHFIPCFIANSILDECWPYYRCVRRLTSLLQDNVCDALFIQLLVNVHEILYNCFSALLPRPYSYTHFGLEIIRTEESSMGRTFGIVRPNLGHATWFRVQSGKKTE